jgi:phosphoethanolamine N-methyltransferase
MKFRTLFLIFLQIVIYLDLYGTPPTKASHQEAVNTSVSEEYEDDFIALVEMIYGEGLLSQGGINSIDEMFHGINLDGLKLLDLGSGLGMYDIYLAKRNCVEIVGLDPQEILVQKANLNLEKAKNDLKGTVSFSLMKNPNNLNGILDNSFDVVFSKESILHVPYEVKESYFKEIYRVLKPDGKIIIMDWMHSGPIYTANTRKMMEMDGIVFQLSTPSEYENFLKKAGFNDIELIDTTLQHAQFSQQNINTIISIEEKIKSSFGEDAYNYSIESWTYQRDAFKTRELLTGIFKAYK